MNADGARIVLVLGREPDLDVPYVAARAVAEARGRVAVLVVGDRPNEAQAAVMEQLLRMSSAWMDSLFVHDVGLSDIGDDDEVIVAASGRERDLLQMLFAPPRRAAG